jgi:serine beta-lactamase-like protein LACTB, mitochondrial
MIMIASNAPAQRAPALTPAQSAAIEREIRAAMTSTKAPAVSIAITRDTSIVLQHTFGTADLENNVPATDQSVYRIASVSKPITAVAVMQLVEQGKLDLDAEIQKYVPEYPEQVKPITLRQLLLHTSGIRHYKSEREFSTILNCDSLAEAIPIFGDSPLEHPPGDKITYSTWGFVLLGVAVERASGLRFTDYLQRHIFKPAGMVDSRQDVVFDIVPHRVRGYERHQNGEIHNPQLVNTSCRIPAGGLLSTAGDLGRFLIALQNGRLLKPATVDIMFRNYVTPDLIQRTVAGQTIPPGYEFPGFGLGWAISTPGRKGVLWHGGNQQGATSIIYWIPQTRTGIAILMNLEAQGNEIVALADKIAAVLE